jgi:putative copper export protein
VDSAPLFDFFTIARWLGYVGTFVLIGAATFRLLIRFKLQRHHPAAGSNLVRLVRRVAITALLILLLAALFKLWGQLATLRDPGEPMTGSMALALIRSEGWGRGWLWQVGIATLCLILVITLGRAWVITLSAIALAAVAPLTGHATENPWGPVAGVVLHTIHQLGGGVWLGTLSVIVLLGYGGTTRLEKDERHLLIARLVNAYSPLALAGVGTAVLAGVILAYTYVGSLSALLSSGYGKTLVVKTALLALTAGLGAYNWKRVRPALGSSIASERLLRSATIELIVGTLLLLATAVLVAMAAPVMEM